MVEAEQTKEWVQQYISTNSKTNMIDTSGSGSMTFHGTFKLNGMIILRPTAPINWAKEIVQDVITGMI